MKSEGSEGRNEETQPLKGITIMLTIALPGGAELNVDYGNGSDGDMVVKDKVSLDPSRTYNFTTLTIKKGGVLLISTNLSLTLRVKDKFVNEKGGCVNLNGKGYKGGLAGYQGTSYSGQGLRMSEPNAGGGGGGYWGGGGGGYGTAGQVAGGGKGGCVYGDHLLSELFMGSGGIIVFLSLLPSPSHSFYFFTSFASQS
jgi:hypothetical protein